MYSFQHKKIIQNLQFIRNVKVFLQNYMKARYLTLIFVFSFFNSLSQDRYTISGFIQDFNSGESLIGVSIYESKSFKGTSTNQYGFYSLTLDKGEYEIVYSFIGYKTKFLKCAFGWGRVRLFESIINWQKNLM